MTALPTLGWAILEHIRQLPSPADPAKPFILIPAQAEFVLDWYTFDPATLEFVYRRGALMMPKGWGKSPLGAALAIAEFTGPVIPDGFDADGSPVGRPWGTGGQPAPWVQIAACSEDQATSNVYSIIFELLSLNHGKAAEVLGIDLGRTRLYLGDKPGAKLESVTADAGSRQGQRVTFAVLDETQLWTPTNRGVKLARTLRMNCGKTDGRSVEFTNAPELGESSVAEQTVADVEAGESGILFAANRPSVEPNTDMSDDRLRALLREVYDDVPWVDPRRLLREIRDPSTSWSDALRYYFNLPAPGGGALADPPRWSELATDAAVASGSRVALGFVGDAVNAAALVLCTEDGRLGVVGVWERPVGATEWRVPRTDVAKSIAWAFSEYDVARFLGSPWEWRTELESWAEKYGTDVVLQLPTNSTARMLPAIDRFTVAVAEGALSHDGDASLARHVANARIGHRGMLESAGPGRHIIAAVAAVFALEARAGMGEAPEMTPLVAWT